jgi:hypothetical protein
MAERDFRFDRHYELWKEQNKQITRWVYGTAIFATIVLLRVLVPYTDSSHKVSAGQAELAGLEAELGAIGAEQQALATLSQRLEAVRAAIDGQPWNAEKRQLIDGLRQLTEAYRMLSGASPVQVQQAIRETGPPVQAPIAQQMAPVSPPPHPVVQAVTVMGLDPERLAGASPGEFRRLLEERLPLRAQEEADEKVRRIFQRVSAEVILPLERLLREEPGAAGVLPALPATLAQTRSDMEQWLRQHLGNHEWFRTIRGKDQELGELTESLRRRQDALLTLVQDQQKRLEPRRKALAERQQQTQAQAAAIGRALADLNVKMQKLLPDWLRDLVLPEEMLQLYPLILLGLTGVIAVKAGLLRRHYLVVREGKRLGGLALRDGAVSSLWTLVYRGALGSAATCAMYFGGTALLWWLFERGSSLAAHWLSAQPAAAWPGVRDWLPVIRWLGRGLFAGAILGTAGTILGDRLAVAGAAPDGEGRGSA